MHIRVAYLHTFEFLIIFTFKIAYIFRSKKGCLAPAIFGAAETGEARSLLDAKRPTAKEMRDAKIREGQEPPRSGANKERK